MQYIQYDVRFIERLVVSRHFHWICGDSSAIDIGKRLFANLRFAHETAIYEGPILISSAIAKYECIYLLWGRILLLLCQWIRPFSSESLSAMLSTSQSHLWSPWSLRTFLIGSWWISRDLFVHKSCFTKEWFVGCLTCWVLFRKTTSQAHNQLTSTDKQTKEARIKPHHGDHTFSSMSPEVTADWHFILNYSFSLGFYRSPLWSFKTRAVFVFLSCF